MNYIYSNNQNIIFNISGVDETGAAAPHPQNGMALITIEGGNEPHGVFSFAQSSLDLAVEEGDTTAELTITRRYGNIGKEVFLSMEQIRH